MTEIGHNSADYGQETRTCLDILYATFNEEWGAPVYSEREITDAPFGNGEIEPEEDNGLGWEWEAEFAWNNPNFYAQVERSDDDVPITDEEFAADREFFDAREDRCAEFFKKRSEPRTEPYVKKPIPSKLRWAVFRRDGYCCVKCKSDEDLTADHIHPEVKGGKATIHNLQTLCRSCNSKKGTK